MEYYSVPVIKADPGAMEAPPACDTSGKSMIWYVYIILCSDNSLYTGITTDVEKRFSQHAGGRGAKYFRGRQPVQVVYRESGHNRSSASRREFRIKTMNRADKMRLVDITEYATPVSMLQSSILLHLN
jgi:putative endonuclease